MSPLWVQQPRSLQAGKPPCGVCSVEFRIIAQLAVIKMGPQFISLPVVKIPLEPVYGAECAATDIPNVPSEMQQLSSDHSKTAAQTTTNQKDIEELRLEMVSVCKGLEDVKTLKVQVQAIDDKVNHFASWKHAHVAEHANLKLSPDQHIQ